MKLNRLVTRTLFVSALLLGGLLAPTSLLAIGTSTTTLNVSSTSVTLGTAVTLTATSVDSATSSPITHGQIRFCDASPTYCEGQALLGVAQLTSSGTASIKLMLGSGTHSVTATFIRGAGYLGDTSAPKTVTVTGVMPTSTTISPTGSAGAYTLGATVSYHGLLVPSASETVTFQDTSNANYSLGTASLSAVSLPVYSFISVAGSPFDSGDFPGAETVGDFNGDGILDLAVASYTLNTVSVFAGDGLGGFSPLTGSPFVVGNAPTALAVADVNNDGLADLISVNSSSASVSILLGNSRHTLVPGGTFVTGNGPQAIAIADFDHDGNADIAIANLLDSTITVLLGDGTGNFTNAPMVSAYTSGNPNALVSDDFNGDGNADIATSNLDGTYSVLLGDGAGNFTAMAGSPFASTPYPSTMAVGDFNGDGKADFAIGDASLNEVTVLLNNVGTFTASTGSPFAVGLNPMAVGVSDFNGDGKQDIAVLNSDDNNATILLGDGAGGFTPSSQSPLGGMSAPTSLAIADLNGDGTPDLAIGNVGVSKISIRALQISQTASATMASSIAVPGGGTHLVAATYGGDTSYATSTSLTTPLTGTKISNTSSLFVSPGATVQYLQTMQLTGSVTPASSANYSATGTGTFADGGTTIAIGSVSSGSALTSVNSLAVGNHTLTFSYAGDANFTNSTTASATAVTVTRANTMTSLTSSAAAASPGTPITFTAKVAPVTAGTPTGTVNFYSDGALIGTGTLSGGVASFTTSTLSTAVYTLSAGYLGDGNYVGSSATGSTSLTVSDFAVTMTPSIQTVVPGQSVNFGLTVTPVNGAYNAPVTFSVSGLPAGATATFQPSTVTPGTTATSVTLTITTQSLAASLEHHAGIVAAVLLLPFAFTRRRLRSAMKGRLLALTLLLLAGAFASGCGKGNGYFDQGTKNYTVTVTATSGAVSHSSTITLNVQ